MPLSPPPPHSPLFSITPISQKNSISPLSHHKFLLKMINSKVYEYLKHYLGEYLYGLEKDHLEVGLLSGNINLTNVNFKPDKVSELFVSQGFPLHLKAGIIGRLQLKFHNISLTAMPLHIIIDELLLVFGPIIENDFDA